MRKVLVIFGTRPEAIKMCPLVRVLNERPGVETRVCVTGQHREMLDQVLEVFDVHPDVDLSIMQKGQDLFDITLAILQKLRDVLRAEAPDVVLVHGDTTTAFVAMLSAFYLGIPVGHVEAGLRTGRMDSPFPEEFNRQAIGLVATYHFAPTSHAAEDLLREGKDPARVFVTGNTVVDAMRTTVREDFSHPLLDWIGPRRLLFMTAHRRENWGAPLSRIFQVVRGLLLAHPDLAAIYPVHMNPKVREPAFEILGDVPNLKLVDPLDVVACHNLEARAFLCLTDSGGIQEECAALGTPTLVLRETTERPEGVATGNLRLVGTDADRIIAAVTELIEDPAAYQAMRNAQNPYGDGHASERIADILENEA